jgi:hypothetical protein
MKSNPAAASVLNLARVVQAGPNIALALLALSAAVGFALILRLVDGDFLNSYPFISPDGSDWIYEGAYLKTVLAQGTGALAPPLMLRHPVFVLVSGLDFVAGHRGIAFAAALSVAFFASGVFLVLILRELRIRPSIILWAVLVYILTPFSQLRFWVLADGIAIAFLHASTFYLLRYDEERRLRHLLLAIATALLGGWTQTYAIIPCLLGAPLIVLRDLLLRRNVLAPIAAGLAGIAVYVLVLWAWYRGIAHEHVPLSFALLALNANMAAFYANTWAFFLGPFACCVAYWLFVLRAGRPPLRFRIAILAAIVAAFSGLAFFYQWPEARFTFIYLGLVIVLAAAMLETGAASGTGVNTQDYARGAAMIASLAAVVLTSFVLVPASYWNPSLSTLRIRPRESWFMGWVSARPVDRFRLRESCKTTREFCSATPVAGKVDPYQDRLLGDYRALMMRGGK